jgi:hypothetical protein
MRTKMKAADRRLLATRLTLSTRLEVTGEQPVQVGELLQNDQMASTLLSKASMRVFDGNSTMRVTARALDYLAYGRQLIERGDEISKSIIKAVGVRQVGDLVATDAEE